MATGDSESHGSSLDVASDVYKRVLDHGVEGVLQSIVCKDLKLSSRDGSRLVIRLERRGMIRREKILEDGRWTYKLTPLLLPVQIRSIEQAPCITCPYESKCSLTGVVSPLSCPWISEWVVKEFRERSQISVKLPVDPQHMMGTKRVTATAR
ncbi:MAG: transcriptional regulator [Nitrososphaerota archaeon]|nr:transcriptional regulator [Nitrososphaerota archaeon]